MRALFARKVSTIEELKELTQRALQDGKVGKPYVVDEEVTLSDQEFQSLSKNLLADQPWIKPRANCIRVINESTGERLLIDPQGYQYCRYVSLELE